MAAMLRAVVRRSGGMCRPAGLWGSSLSVATLSQHAPVEAPVTAPAPGRAATEEVEPVAGVPSDTHQRGAAYSYGEGYLGCLGHPKYSDLGTPAQLPLLADVPVVDVSCGWGHSAMVTAAGQLLVCGRTHDFANTLRQINLQRGPSFLSRAINFVSERIVGLDLEPQPVDVPGVLFDSVVCSPGSLTVAIAEDSSVYCYGSNDHGQCGIGEVNPSVYTPEAVPGVAASQVAAGFQHVAAVGHGGEVLVWGRGDRGQLGLGDREPQKLPQQVLGRGSELEGVRAVDVAAGFSHTSVVTEDGRAWVWGKMQADEPSPDGKRILDQLMPRLIPLDTDRPVVGVTCGQAHTCFLTDDNTVWMRGLRGRGVWYDNTGAEPDEYCLSVMDPSARLSPAELMQFEPLPLSLSPLLRGASIVGLRSGVHHSYAVLDDGRVLKWGWRMFAVEEPSVKGLDVLDFSTGFAHTMLCVAPSEPSS